MRNLFIILLSVIAVFTAVLSNSNSADAFGAGEEVLKGEVIYLKPETVTMKTEEGQIEVDINDINVEDMDAEFLQIGDTMSVQGHYDDRLNFDAEELIGIKPYTI